MPTGSRPVGRNKEWAPQEVAEPEKLTRATPDRGEAWIAYLKA